MSLTCHLKPRDQMAIPYWKNLSRSRKNTVLFDVKFWRIVSTRCLCFEKWEVIPKSLRGTSWSLPRDDATWSWLVNFRNPIYKARMRRGEKEWAKGVRGRKGKESKLKRERKEGRWRSDTKRKERQTKINPALYSSNFFFFFFFLLSWAHPNRHTDPLTRTLK
jgi:hypothetical protein